MSVQIKITKTSTYGVDSQGNYLLHHPGIGFKPMTEEELKRKRAYKDPYGWISFDASTCDEALALYEAQRKEEIEKRKAEREAQDSADQAKIKELLELDVIPSTAENIRLVMKYLNQQNWGSWTLPKMEIGYKAHQYDCEGQVAVTFQLDRPVEGETKLSFNAPRGHLRKYQDIRMYC